MSTITRYRDLNGYDWYDKVIGQIVLMADQPQKWVIGARKSKA